MVCGTTINSMMYMQLDPPRRGQKKIFDEIMTASFSNMMYTIHSQIQTAQRPQEEETHTPKTTQRHISNYSKPVIKRKCQKQPVGKIHMCTDEES